MQKIDIKYLQGYKLAIKEDKDFRKNKSTDIFSANLPGRKQQSSIY